MTISSKLVGVGTFFTTPTSIESTSDRIKRESKARVPARIIEKLTGVKNTYRKDDGVNASDLAVNASRKALADAGLTIQQIDLLIFASASQDLIEPATAHIIAAGLGATCPVFDVKNACNSFVNGLQVADALIKQGVYKRVLVCTGETPSMAVRWSCNTKDEFARSFPGFSMSDTGGAVVLEGTDTDTPTGLLSFEASANSEMWDVGMLGTGGSRAPRDLEATYFNMDGHKLYDAFKEVGCQILFEKLDRPDFDWNHFAYVGMHQVSSIYNEMLFDQLEIPKEKIIRTIVEHGNLASNSFPVQFEIARKNMKPGDKFAFIGLGGGISTVFMVVEV